MTRRRWWLVLPALIALAVASGTSSAAEIKDKAKLFTPEAVKTAQRDLDRLQEQYDVPVTLETVDSLEGETIKKVIVRHAEAVGAQGVYILISKNDREIDAESSKHFAQYLSRSRMTAVVDAIRTEFKAKDYDRGLSQGVSKLSSVLSDAQTDAGGKIRQNTAPNTKRGGAAVPARRAPAPARTSFGGFSLIGIILGVLALFFVIRMLGALFGAMRGNQYGGGPMMGGRGGYPGPGGPGYGGGYGGAPAGGGGFMSSLFGGLGGAMAGNWLYDQFSGRQHGASMDQTSYDQTQAPVEDNSPDWGGTGASASWGDDAAASDAPAGGDWGGGGGGDWGGGGDTGGGDWGGGGNDDGGSW